MARGWESKSVADQQEEKSRGRSEGSSGEAGATDRRRTLELSRANLRERVARAPQGALRRSLERALEDLERQLEIVP